MTEWQFPQEITNFAEAARRFVGYVEAAHTYELLERLVRGAAAVGELYTAGLYLPIQDPPEDPDEPPAPQKIAEWEGYEELTMFWHVPDAYAWGAPEVVSLTDLLLDTHRDIKQGLMLFDQGVADQDEAILGHALWYWRDRMEKYWAAKSVDALRALSRAIQKVSNGERDF
ncbi:MAG TPA: DUF5063 domain-containing protein [Aggregatilineales bacterium]|nr:DUF5063 domain-containing protein [Anaerolineales bacterium]HRE48961.1 DUF5063 domain-containing protein [Aggregatilineales bacterium]